MTEMSVSGRRVVTLAAFIELFGLARSEVPFTTAGGISLETLRKA
jgi:hypothetical protein